VLEAAQRATGLTPNKARALLGQFLFSGEEAEKPIVGLSGGERQRLSLAILVHSGANVLILDEPTNHLDVESREALEEALEGFPGSVLLVSHDRAMLDAVGSRTVAVEDGTLHSYEGGWADYLRMREERRALEEAAAAAGAKADKATTKGNVKPAAANGNGAAKPARSKNAIREAQKLEREIEAAEAALQALEEELADPAAWSDPDRAADSTERHAAARRAVEELYARYERVAG
jgi:ATP-binding cassette subfamily F protein 3